MEKHNKKRKILLESTFPDNLNNSLESDRNDNEVEIKTITEITIRKIIRSFNLFASRSCLRAMKKTILSPNKVKIKTR